MSAKDLDSILPTSNADKSESEEYEYYSDDGGSDDEKEVTKAADKAKKHIHKTKSKSIKDVSSKQKIRTKRPKGPSRSVSVGDDKSMGALQTTDPTAHVLEAPKPMFVKQAIDNQFNKTHRIDISRATQLGIKKERYYDPDPIREMYEEIDSKKWYKQKKWIITMSVVGGILVLLAIIWAVYYITKRRTLARVDPLSSPISGGNKSDADTDDKEKNINYITSPALNKDKNPPSFYDDYDNKSEKDEEIAERAVNDVPKGKYSRSPPPKPVAKKDSKPVRELPKRGKDGKFISSKK